VVQIKLGYCLTTGIGSLPLTDSKVACSKILKSYDIPFWPQLPKIGFSENMYAQFSQGIPGIIIEDERIYVDSSQDLNSMIENILQDFVDERNESYAIEKDYATGLYDFLELSDELKNSRYIKGQITGPISYGLQVCDKNRKPLLYNESLMDIVLKVLIMKLKWQEDMLRKLNKNTIMFLDEPLLNVLGSAFVSLTESQVIDYLNQTVSSIRGTSGIHCCGNTNWGIVMNSGTDIVSFDAYNYGTNFILYHKEIAEFLERGGIIAWGIVPSSPNIRDETPETIVRMFNVLVKKLVNNGIDKRLLVERSLITPSCGTGSLTAEEDELVSKYIGKVAQIVKKEYGVV